MTFNFNLSDIIALLTILGSTLAIFSSYVIRPLREAIYALKDQLKDISVEIEKSRMDRSNFQSNLSRLDESLKSAHKRIDSLEKRVELFERSAP